VDGRALRSFADAGVPVSENHIDFSLWTDFRPAPGMPMHAHYEEVIKEIRRAEELGFWGVWTSEQHGVDDGYLPAQLPMLAALARETARIRLGTGVILLPLTQFRRVVEEACVVDVLSGGRLTLGVGAGNYPHEFKAFGVPRDRRGQILEEGIRFLKPGLAGEMLADGLPVNVRPIQNPIPLVVGGLAEKAVDRAVRLGDGHFAYANVDAGRELPRLWGERISPALARHGRTLKDFRLVAGTIIWASHNFEREWMEVVGPAFIYQQKRYAEWDGEAERAEGYLEGGEAPGPLMRRMLVGPPREIADRLVELHSRYPFHELACWPRLPGVPHALALEQLELLATEVFPLVNVKLASSTD
jgi:alkanesulfonate monooxygenase SsuD/methylene tetrahydromethanopterin reductase-like flavin-dependent oxidoreductase (luciferase family)